MLTVDFLTSCIIIIFGFCILNLVQVKIFVIGQFKSFFKKNLYVILLHLKQCPANNNIKI